MNDYSSGNIESQTTALNLYAQLIKWVGIIFIVLGFIFLIGTIIAEFGGEGTVIAWSEVAVSAATLVYGLALMAVSGILTAVRSIAVNCARIAEKE